ncbi:RING-H2 finger protein ATL60-like [Benincasa hispida]|uniref:RING-H2 finger protein ATL60-like n=1 Tax=Benincasa hispida TaxID=102211 RepID=UPI0019029D30|nr:RING-H2 finger protein ATL60-like [Benincasa hispida]
MEEHASTINRPFGGSFAMELTGKIMLAAILILCLVIAFVLILQLYSRWFLSHIHQSSPDSAANHESPVSSTLHKGLDSALLQSIPVVVFSPADFEEGLECAVCLSELSEGEKARLLPICNHGFHVDCIDMWFKSNSTCPLCRNPVIPTESNSEHNLESGSSMESPIFPTNVLFWGNQMQVSSRGICLEESQISSSSANTRADGNGMVVIDIPNEPSTSGAGGCFADEETGSVVTNRLRTLKRLLSRERRIGNNLTSSDLEQVGIVQS